MGLLMFLVLSTSGCADTPSGPEPAGATDKGRASLDSRTGEGPLKSAPPTGYALRRDKGAVLTDGWVVLYNFGDAPITIMRVRSKFEGHGLRQLGALVAGYGRKFAAEQTIDDYPPRKASLGPLTAAEGYVLPAEEGRPRKKGHELLIGMQVTQAAGRSARSLVEITYSYKGHTYTDEWVNTIAVCSPAKGPSCPQEYGPG
ncbi:hypothetical protein HCN51_08030 [Nonomuraea sp. FMUSA5-5]|uniref:Lipoprotein n=1 Tax=Nonomuraea composti TaxID=2720023 RepID=A0ABX1AYP1_9ACTN|nr:hypothetical protein [Nonomuraea sp. FMUSA5-5]NJP89397.1 hypothetical protein [Nonomuraea sp. FMUSA5-5]